jgi:hypothetical protein
VAWFPCGKRHFCAIYILKRSFCQDRLGTNIGKALKKQCRFPYRRLEATELRDHELGCRGRIGSAAVASHLALAAAQIKDHTGVAFEGVDSFIGRQDVEDE